MKFRVYVPADPQDAKQQDQRKPPRSSSIGSDVGVPMLQALLTGAFISGLITFLISELAPAWGVNYFKAWFAFWIAASGIAWLIFVADTRWPYSTVLWMAETLFDKDFDKDGSVGRPIMVNRRQPPPAKTSNRHLDDFHAWVRSLPIKGTAYEAHEPTMKRRRYENFRNTLLQGGWAEWKDPQVHTLGWELTEDVETIIANITE